MNLRLKPKRVLWNIFPAFLVLAILSLSAMTWYSTYYFGKVVLQREKETLRQETAVIETLIRRQLLTHDYPIIDSTLKQLAINGKTRVTVILPDGTVIGDSLEDVQTLENHADRIEFIEAIHQKIGISERYSRTLKERTLYVAIPVTENGSPIAVIRASISLDSVHNATQRFYIQILVACALILGIVSVGCYLLYHWLTIPLERLKEGIERFSTGNLQYRLSVPAGDTEMSVITRAVNQMACQLDERFKCLQDEQHEKETILTSLFDGILVVDNNETILNLNNIAADILGFSLGFGPGQKLATHVRNSALIELVRRTIQEKKPSTMEIVFRNHDDEFYQVDCIPIRESSFALKKILVVFHNVTQSKRIQSARREIIMTVSEHLIYPATRIQELSQSTEANDADSVRTSISNEATLLITILNDLIYLTQLEQLAENQKIEFAKIDLATVFQEAATSLHDIATAKSVTVTIAGQGIAHGHASSLHEAAIHLLNNAITYSPTGGGLISIGVSSSDDQVTVTIEDNGIGIPATAIEQIFKPFYRIDTPEHQLVKGGGLGLAIVKAIVDVHRGRMTVQSHFGQGTTFTIHIPASSSGGSHVIPT